MDDSKNDDTEFTEHNLNVICKYSLVVVYRILSCLQSLYVSTCSNTHHYIETSVIFSHLNFILEFMV